MGYSFESHTADIRLGVTGRDKKELFSDAVRGMAHILQPDIEQQPTDNECIIEMSSADTTTLLIDFLNEILTQSHIDKTVYHQVEWQSLTDISLSARVRGVSIPHFDEDIKAVTYHEAAITTNEKGMLQTTIVFDI